MGSALLLLWSGQSHEGFFFVFLKVFYVNYL